MAIDKIKRSFTWIRNALRVIDKTTLPGEIQGDIRPSIDLFGWERLPEEQILQVAAAATGEVLSATPPVGTLRLVLHCSLLITGSGVGVTAIIRKRNALGANCGLPTDRDAIEDDEVASVIGRTFLAAGDVIVAAYVNPPLGGTSTLSLNVVDLDIGEYIPPL